jgi:hypothetical protein
MVEKGCLLLREDLLGYRSKGQSGLTMGMELQVMELEWAGQLLLIPLQTCLLLLDDAQVQRPTLDDSAAHFQRNLYHLFLCTSHELGGHNHEDQKEVQQVRSFQAGCELTLRWEYW